MKLLWPISTMILALGVTAQICVRECQECGNSLGCEYDPDFVSVDLQC